MAFGVMFRFPTPTPFNELVIMNSGVEILLRRKSSWRRFVSKYMFWNRCYP